MLKMLCSFHLDGIGPWARYLISATIYYHAPARRFKGSQEVLSMVNVTLSKLAGRRCGGSRGREGQGRELGAGLPRVWERGRAASVDQ